MKQVYKNSDMVESIPPIETNDNIITDNQEKAEIFMFNTYFLSASHLGETNAYLTWTEFMTMGIILMKSNQLSMM